MLTNIIIVEDSTLVRKGLVSIVNTLPPPNGYPSSNSEAPYNVVADVASSKELFQVLATQTADFLLLDYSLNIEAKENHPLHSLDGQNLIKYIRKTYNIKIIVVSMHHSPVIIRSALEAGAHGYVSKGANEEVLGQALQAVSRGDTFVEHHLLKNLLHQGQQSSTISPKEIEVLRLMGKGNRLTDIAQRMNLSIKTVSAHKLRAMDKLNIQSESELYHVISKMAL